MAGKRKVHTAAFKAQVALAALKGDRTINELAGHYGVHPTLIHGWKKQLLSGAEGVFASKRAGPAPQAEVEQARLFEESGRLKAELDGVKKILFHPARPQRDGLFDAVLRKPFTPDLLLKTLRDGLRSAADGSRIESERSSQSDAP